MNLIERIKVLTDWDGYVKHILHGDPKPKPAADDSTVTVKHYAFWFEVGDHIQESEVEIVVIDEGKGESEAAYIVSTGHLPNQPVALFREFVENKIAEIVITRPELASAHIVSCDEDNCIALVDIWQEIESLKAKKTTYAFFLNDADLTFGETPSLEEKAANILSIIQGG